MQFLQKRIFLLVTASSAFIFSACAPESKYNGGHGALRSYESTDAYGNSTIKYRSDYNQPTQSNFNSTLVASDRDNIRRTPQNMHPSNNEQWGNTQSGTTRSGTSSKKTSTKGTSGKTQQANLPANYESPVQGDGSFKPTQSLLGGMRDSEAIQRATMRPYKVRGKTYYPHPVKVGDTFDGIASWYGPDFHAKATSNGETYNMYAHTAAHKTLPMNTIVKVYNKDNGKTTVVRINDRGPFVEGRIIDLSNVAAHDIAMVGKGIANVRIEVVGFGGNLKNNTPPTDTPTNNQPARQESKQPKQQNNTPPARENPSASEESITQEPVVLKPRQKQPQYQAQEESYPAQPQYQNTDHTATQPTHAHTTPTQPSAPLEPEKDSKQPIKPIESKQPTESMQPMQSAPSQQSQPQERERAPQPQENEVDSNALPQDSMAFGESEELPEAEPQKSAPNATMPEKKPQENKAQQNEEDTLQSAFTNVTPKRIDNTEALKDLDNAMQKIKDSTDDLAQKAKEEAERRAKEEAERRAKEEADRKAKEEAERKAMEETQRAKEEAERRAKEEAERKAMEEAQRAKEELERSAQEQAAKQPRGNFMVSLNVFSQEERAKNFQNESQAFTQGTNYAIEIVPTDKGLYRVAIRGFQTYEEAKAFIAKHNITGHVVAESK